MDQTTRKNYSYTPPKTPLSDNRNTVVVLSVLLSMCMMVVIILLLLLLPLNIFGGKSEGGNKEVKVVKTTTEVEVNEETEDEPIVESITSVTTTSPAKKNLSIDAYRTVYDTYGNFKIELPNILKLVGDASDYRTYYKAEGASLELTQEVADVSEMSSDFASAKSDVRSKGFSITYDTLSNNKSFFVLSGFMPNGDVYYLRKQYLDNGIVVSAFFIFKESYRSVYENVPGRYLRTITRLR